VTTKALSRAARRRLQRQRRISLPGGGSVDQPPSHPNDRRHTNQPPKDPTLTVVAAREARIPPGADPRDRKAGCAVGRRILREPDIARQDRLWDAVCHMRMVYAVYDRALGGPSRYPKCLAILTPPERFEASASSPAIDPRSEDEKYRAAIRDWMLVQGWLGHAPKPAQSVCIAAVVDDAEVMDWEGVLIALECVAHGMGA
jgi:hypothetical protein